MGNINYASIPVVSARALTMFFRRKNQQFVDIIEIIISLLPLPKNKSADGLVRSDLKLISQEPLNYAVPRQWDNLGAEIVDYHGRISGYVPRPNFPYAFRYILPQNPRNTAVGGFRKFIVASKADLSITLITFAVYGDRTASCMSQLYYQCCLQINLVARTKINY